MKPTQADSEIEEEHLLNFAVNSLEEELSIDLGENVKVTTRKLYEVLAGEVTFPVFIDTPRDAREHYNKRFGIESSYRLANQSLAFTSSQDAGLRLVMFVMSLLLQNSWRYLHWRYVATPRRGGADSGSGRS